MTDLICIGVSHKTAPIAVRERVALIAHDAEKLCATLIELPGVEEAVAISTCNRTEVYLAGHPEKVEPAMLVTAAGRGEIDPADLDAAAFRLDNDEAARHLFSVTAGLDSMIPGESEIQGQVKRAYLTALMAGTSGPLTNRLFTAALQTGKRVRSETGIGAGHASVSSVAVQLAEQAVGELPEKQVLIVGAGETAELTAEALAARGVTTAFITNRKAHRARRITTRFGGTVAPLRELPELLSGADIVVSSTSSPHTLVTKGMLQELAGRRAARPLMLIDLAVPRDIEAACGSLDWVSLYDIDSLQRTAEMNLAIREDERHTAEEIVGEELARFAGWLDLKKVTPVIGELRRYGDEIVERALAENAESWESASPRDIARVEALTRAVVQRLLHEPTVRLKGFEPDGDLDGVHVEAIRELFGLEGQAGSREPQLAEVRELRRR